MIKLGSSLFFIKNLLTRFVYKKFYLYLIWMFLLQSTH
ncbi:heat shock hsp20 [Legionella pneumophila subsp. pneumophila LPE509]|nr:heat shock hsp20 [Legionella pneumophila subsp. pneumophila LPE509]